MIAIIVATITTLPFLVFILSYYLIKKMTSNDRKAVRTSADMTTFILILSVTFSFQMGINLNIFWWIIVFMLFLLALFVFLQWKYQQEIIIRTVVKRFWRVSFFIFSFLYLFGVVYGIIYRIMI
ncbi:DUF3397 domain-containing protein [Virgibacillus sp. MSP4-1]|uniref:DUF3397 domain-containing protein n=1 Tax=Virgibacillus sp. MSP4-1 TaxID=2700081 RepID=UPI0005C5D538|nr:DUF3397 domain-containing protein [Virgibacillus sp. MSP4-1]